MADGAPERRILILGGTTEAAQLARAVERRRGLKVISSLAGRTREPAPLPGATRSGGFGGSEGVRTSHSRSRDDVTLGVDVLFMKDRRGSVRSSPIFGSGTDAAAAARV